MYTDEDFERDVMLLYARGGSVAEGLAAEERIIADRNRWKAKAEAKLFLLKERNSGKMQAKRLADAALLRAERDALKIAHEDWGVSHADHQEAIRRKNETICALQAEVERLKDEPHLGCATNAQLLGELTVRAEIHGWATYRTVDGEAWSLNQSIEVGEATR